MTSKDIRQITKDWPFEAGQINVRKIRGEDNRVKIQMRVDLGILQMEVSGRPDSQRPFNCESLLEYHQQHVEAHERRNGTDLGFELSETECREIREEALQYYQRYLANFVLEDYEAVVRDTTRNIDVLDMCNKYASEEEDRYVMEQYRPYIVMMNARSKAMLAIHEGAFKSALANVENGLLAIKDFYKKYGQKKAFRESGEVQVLKTLRREIRSYLPVDPIRKAKKKLRRAVEEERYEEAARIRDELETLLKESHKPI